MDDQEKKAFFSVLKMSEAFREFDAKVKEAMSTGMAPEASNQDKARFIEISMECWNLRFQLAQAQQLTMISESLKKLTSKMVGQ